MTWPLEDMNFIFSWQKQYFAHLLTCNSKIKFISSRHHVISSMYILYYFLFIYLFLIILDFSTVRRQFCTIRFFYN